VCWSRWTAPSSRSPTRRSRRRTPPAIAEKIVGVAHDTFMSGMGLACLVAAGVAAVAVFVALLTKRGANAEPGAGAAHI
jgi:hypothetical protein